MVQMSELLFQLGEEWMKLFKIMDSPGISPVVRDEVVEVLKKMSDTRYGIATWYDSRLIHNR